MRVLRNPMAALGLTTLVSFGVTLSTYALADVIPNPFPTGCQNCVAFTPLPPFGQGSDLKGCGTCCAGPACIGAGNTGTCVVQCATLDPVKTVEAVAN